MKWEDVEGGLRGRRHYSQAFFVSTSSSSILVLGFTREESHPSPVSSFYIFASHPYFYTFSSCFFLLLLVLRCVGLSSCLVLSCLTLREMEGKGQDSFGWKCFFFSHGKGSLGL